MECEDLQAALAEADVANKTVEEVDFTEAVGDFVIREGIRGRPVAEHFVQHVRCLMATGSSARSCREQLLLSAMYFLKGTQAQEAFMEEVPTINWFNKQREPLAKEAYLYSLTRLAKCEAVEQWGFDESGLDGVPRSLNQWCRIREDEAYLAEGPFATVRAFLHMYPSLKLRTVAGLSGVLVNGTHRAWGAKKEKLPE